MLVFGAVTFSCLDYEGQSFLWKQTESCAWWYISLMIRIYCLYTFVIVTWCWPTVRPLYALSRLVCHFVFFTIIYVFCERCRSVITAGIIAVCGCARTFFIYSNVMASCIWCSLVLLVWKEAVDFVIVYHFKTIFLGDSCSDMFAVQLCLKTCRKLWEWC